MRRHTSKKNGFLRALLITALVLIAAAAAFGVATAVKYRASAKSAGKAVIEQPPVLSADKDVPIGENIRVTATIRIPWGRRPVAFDALPGKGAQLAGAPEFVRESINWGSTLWRFSAVIHAYRSGLIEPGTMTAVLEGGAERKQELSMSLPGFTAKALPVSDREELVTAGKIEESGGTAGRSKLLIALIAVIAAAGILFVLLRSRKARKQAPPPWTVALDTIGHIRSDLHNGRANAASAIVSLTDVIRAYLESRFHLRVEHQTTREFLDDIRRGGPLDAKQSSFLKEFLNSADMVKFARAPADVMLFDEAAARAETLVRETAVPEAEQGKEVSK